MPEHSSFGYDVIEYIGKALFIKNKTDLDIQQDLKKKNIPISVREIAYLGKKFIILLALCHQAIRSKLNNHMQLNGGYILHLDGTCEGNSPHLISSIDELSDIVLDNIKVPSENIKQLVPYLQKIKESYGEPIAIMHDMSNSIIKAVNTVFPGVKDLICHYHFLRDLGKDLFGMEYNNIRRYLQKWKVRTHLRKISRELNEHIKQNEYLNECRQNYLMLDQKIKLPSIIAIYFLIMWILESTTKLNGYGFPFDRAHFEFCLRLIEAYPIFKKLHNFLPPDFPKLSLSIIKNTLDDSGIKQSIALMKEKCEIFDEIRRLMRIAQKDEDQGLNDNGKQNLKNIEEQVKSYCTSNKIQVLANKHLSIKKMTKQFNKYWDKLFAEPIEVNIENRTIAITPQRTNNVMETFFRSFKSGRRKKSGTSNLSKVLKAILADMPLVKNLSNAEYLDIILNGKLTLAERFAEIDLDLVRQKMKKEEEHSRKYPKGMNKVFKNPNLPAELSKYLSKLSCAA